VVAPSERAQLEAALARFALLELRMRQRRRRQRLGQRPGTGHGVLQRRDVGVQPTEQPGGNGPIAHRLGVVAEAQRRHAATDVATDGRRIEQPRGGNHGADAHLLREVHVGHDGDTANVVAGGEPRQRPAHRR
jgi:hypothetical protein